MKTKSRNQKICPITIDKGVAISEPWNIESAQQSRSALTAKLATDGLKIKPHTGRFDMNAFAKFGIDETTISVGDEIVIHASQKFTPTFHADNYIAWIERHEDGTIKRFATSNYNCVITEKMRVKFISMEGCENFESYTNLKGYEKTKHALARADAWVASSMRRGMFTPVADMNLAHDEWVAERYSFNT